MRIGRSNLSEADTAPFVLLWPAAFVETPGVMEKLLIGQEHRRTREIEKSDKKV